MIYKPFIAKTRIQDTSLIITIPADYVQANKVKDKTYYWFQIMKEVTHETKQRDSNIHRKRP